MIKKYKLLSSSEFLSSCKCVVFIFSFLKDGNLNSLIRQLQRNLQHQYLQFIKLMEQTTFTLIIQGKHIPVPPSLYKQIGYLQEWSVLNSPHSLCSIADSSVVSLAEWHQLVSILEHYGGQLPPTSKPCSSITSEHLDPFLNSLFNTLSLQQLNRLYLVAHFLKVPQIKRVIAVFLGCKVYVKDSVSFVEQLKMNKVSAILTSRLQQTYKQEYPFLD